MNNGKWTLAFVMILLVAVFVSGCSGEKQTQGVVKVGGETCYIIEVPSDDISRYFTRVSEEGMSSVLDTATGEKRLVKYYAVEEGGWIAYIGNRVMYIPETASQNTVKFASASLSPTSKAMTLEEAEKYIPWLADKE